MTYEPSAAKYPLPSIRWQIFDRHFLRYLDLCYAIPASHKLKTFLLLTLFLLACPYGNV